MPDRIICYGDIIDDIVVVPQGPIRADTDTPSMIWARPGGSAANTAAWLAGVGQPVDFIGVVGTGDSERHARALPGVDTYLREHPTLPTGRIVIIVRGDQRDMLTDRGANRALRPEDIPDERLDAARLLHFTGHVLLDDAGFDGVRRLIERCHAAEVLVSVSAGSASLLDDLGPGRVRAALEGTDFLFAGYDEGRLLTGFDNPDAIAQDLARQFQIVLVTQGRLGATVAEGTTVFSVAAAPSEAADPTGAGDAFCAGFLHKWLAHSDTRVAARVGAALAAEAVKITGGRPPKGRVFSNLFGLNPGSVPTESNRSPRRKRAGK